MVRTDQTTQAAKALRRWAILRHGKPEGNEAMTMRRMECCVCGSGAGRWQQHWNRDTGFGVCVACIKWLRGRNTSEAEIADLYGKEGVNWGPPPEMVDGVEDNDHGDTNDNEEIDSGIESADVED